MNSSRTIPEGPVIFFDGYCNLCSNVVLFVIRNENGTALRFASLQSEFAIQTLSQIPQIDTDEATLILWLNGKEYYRSNAALRICGYLKSPWKYFGYARYLPRVLRDGVYRLVAKYRYAVFGKNEHCMIPAPELESRFLD